MDQTPSRLPSWWRQDEFQAFRADYLHDWGIRASDMCFFVGAGISRSASLPSGRSFPGWMDLVLQLAMGCGDAGVLRDVRAILGATPDGSALKKAASRVRASFASTSAWTDAVRKPFQRPDEPFTSEIHELLARARWGRCITTNYDTLIEDGCKGVRRGPSPKVYHPWHPETFRLERVPDRVIFKIHGDAHDSRSALVLAEEEYDELYQLMGGEAKIAKLAFGGLIRSAPLVLFLGAGHNDSDVARLWEEQGCGHRENVFALVTYQTPIADFERTLRERHEKTGMRFISYDPADGHREVLDFVRFLADPEKEGARYEQVATRRRPTVVLVHAGGSIGSNQEDRGTVLKVTKIQDRRDPRLERLSGRLRTWYRDFHGAGRALDFDLAWEVVPEQLQGFSENATPLDWQARCDWLHTQFGKYFETDSVGRTATLVDGAARRRLEDEHPGQDWNAHGAAELPARYVDHVHDRYVLGVVLLCGTDTMGYTAAALALAFRDLPCPLVLTGSYLPPVPSRATVDFGRFFRTSDAWHNLMTSLLFLQTVGHAFAEVFVCFGNAITSAVNVRKVGTEPMPFSTEPFKRRDDRPFTFRNQVVQGRYMLRMVEGIFVENYRFRLASILSRHDERHGHSEGARAEAARRRIEAPELTMPLRFSPRVWHIRISPGMAPLDVNAIMADTQDGELPCAVLIEGYTSSGFATHASHALSRALGQLGKRDVPVVLVSPYGIRSAQHEDETEPVNGKPVEVLRLYNVVEETALPLLCLAVERLDPGAWNECRPGLSLTATRLDRIEAEIDRLLEERGRAPDGSGSSTGQEKVPDLVKLELLGVLAREEEEEVYQELRVRVVEREHGRATLLPWFVGRSLAASEASPRAGWLSSLLVEEMARPYEYAGTGPDGFANLSWLGFDLGLACQDMNGGWGNADGRTDQVFGGFPDKRRKELYQCATDVLATMAATLGRALLIPVRADLSPFESPDDPSRSRVFDLAVHVARRPWLNDGEMGERFAVAAFARNDEDFFSLLAGGHGRETSAEAHEAEVARAFRDLRTHRWANRLYPVDWFVIGYFKGVACGMLRTIRFDPVVAETRHPSAQDRVRTALAATVWSDANSLSLRLRYHPLEPA